MDSGKPFGLEPIGLAARNTLRLEAKLLLYGNDMDDTTTVLEADLGWICKLDKGDFIGRGPAVNMKTAGPARNLVGFVLADKAFPRQGYQLVAGGKQVRQVMDRIVGDAAGRHHHPQAARRGQALDQLCFTGIIGWGRLTPPQQPNGGPFAPIRSSPIALYVRENLPAWLYRVTANLAISRLRHEQSLFARFRRASQGDEALADSPEALFEQQERASAALTALRELPARERVVVCMKVLDGKSQREIAETLAMSEGYVSKLLARAREVGLAAAAKDAGLATQQTGLFARRAGSVPTLGAAPQLREVAFTLTSDAALGPEIYVVSGDAVVVALAEKQPEEARALLARAMGAPGAGAARARGRTLACRACRARSMR